MSRRGSTDHGEIVKRLSNYVPKFTDIFDEESFYVFFIVLTIASVIGAVLMSRHFTLKDSGHID